jgi:hypothetical protein
MKGVNMPLAPQLSVRSARARDLAHQLSHLEQRPIHQIVEEALEAYALKKGQVLSFKDFLARLKAIKWPVEEDEVDILTLARSNEPNERVLDL